jgi:hypothetical protein
MWMHSTLWEMHDHTSLLVLAKSKAGSDAACFTRIQERGDLFPCRVLVDADYTWIGVSILWSLVSRISGPPMATVITHTAMG